MLPKVGDLVTISGQKSLWLIFEVNIGNEYLAIEWNQQKTVEVIRKVDIIEIISLPKNVKPIFFGKCEKIVRNFEKGLPK